MNYEHPQTNFVSLLGKLYHTHQRTNTKTGEVFGVANLVTQYIDQHGNARQHWHDLIVSKELMSEASTYWNEGNTVRVTGRILTTSVKVANQKYHLKAARIGVEHIELVREKYSSDTDDQVDVQIEVEELVRRKDEAWNEQPGNTSRVKPSSPTDR